MPTDTAPRPPAELGSGWRGKADTWAGLATLVFGVATLYISADYGLGRAGRIGAGYVPLIVGVLLCGLGLLLIGRATYTHDAVDTDVAWRPLLLVVGGIVTFALLLDHIGLIATIIVAVIVAAPAARGNTIASVVISGAVLSAFSWALFVYFLKISIPVWWF